ncbi:hypothetical protein AOQ84DRAFT_380656 [Glonium stellatum]|uniref:Uncharacterized protein n=1 Tax=Glonium stellatum TaxID=574774 RepID=A0A8E2ET17_9PEZI|nr:hypothetical protein AOQ84DRAFT_380656 [Glonium stellatum]
MYFSTSLTVLVLALSASLSATPIHQAAHPHNSRPAPRHADTPLAARDYCANGNGWYGTRVTCSYRTVPLSIARTAIASACSSVTSCTPGSGTYPFGASSASGFRWSNETTYNATTYNSTTYTPPTSNNGRPNQTQVEVTAMVKIGEQCVDGQTTLDTTKCASNFEGYISAQCGGPGLDKDQFAMGTVFFMCDGSMLSVGEVIGL